VLIFSIIAEFQLTPRKENQGKVVRLLGREYEKYYL
jgi:hypothetical protein